MEIVWKDVVGYEQYFKVSNDGKIYSKRTNKLLVLGLSKKGYPVLSTRIGGRKGKALCLKVHRLVAEAFIENTDNKRFINHIDGNKENNVVTNLEWCTPKENSEHAYSTGLATGRKGELNGSAVLSDNDVIEIRRRYKPRCKKNGCRALAKEFGVSHPQISRAINKLSYQHLN